MSGVVLGLDAGGSKTAMALVDAAGRVQRLPEAGALDPGAGSDWEDALARIARAVGPVVGAVLGLPWHGEVAAISARQVELTGALFGPGARVVNDVALAHAAAFAGGEGVLVLAGTGSMAWARGPGGEHRVGGWGDYVGDEGSAHWIGQRALQRVSQELDGRIQGKGFAAALLGRLGLGPEALPGWVLGLGAGRRAAVAALAMAVSDMAADGWGEAEAILDEAGQLLAEQGRAAGRLAGLPIGPWSLAGGAMDDPVLRAALERGMGLAPVPPILPPLGGALLLAARDRGWAVDRDFVARLAQGLAAGD